MSKHKLVFKIIALATAQFFTFTTSVSAYSTLSDLSKVKKELRVPATAHNPEELVESLGGDAGIIHLVRKVNKLSRVKDGIIAGVGLPDIHGRIFESDSRFFTLEGNFSSELAQFINTLSDKSVQETIHAGIMYYDIRSKFWRDNPAFTVVFALAFAKKIQQKTGKKDGIILHLGVDAYHKHFQTAQIFADAILRTGICDNGGGIYYWGVINGGDMRNYGQLYEAVNGEGANWVYFTMSHKTDDFLGAKMGINAQIFSGSEVRHCEGVTSGTLYDAIVEKDFAEIKHKEPVGDIANIENFLANNIQVAADMIRSTSARAKKDIPINELLKGAKLYVDMGGNPIGKNLVDMLKALGADVKVGNAQLEFNYSIEQIIDPNEHRSPAVQRLRKIAKETGRVVLAVDPDGDRGSIVALTSAGTALSMTGSELLLLTIENLSQNYHAQGKIATIISDMRTGTSAVDLEKILNNKDVPVKVIPQEAGYPFFMRGMASLPADVAVENSTHAFTNPMTNKNWGAPQDYKRPDGKGYQGGDNAALFLIYLLGCMVHQWEGRNPVEQLEWVRKTYDLKETFVDERKPKLPVDDDKFKYMIADRMKTLADEWFKDDEQFLINFGNSLDAVMSGVHITKTKTGAMMLVRFSNTGASFTISGEGYSQEELNEMLGLGHLLLTTAVEDLHSGGHKFGFDVADAADLEGIFKLPAGAEKEKRYALDKHNLSEIEKEAEETMEQISKEGMLEALTLMSGKEKADLQILKEERPELKPAIAKLTKIGFEGDNARLGWLGAVRWILENTEGLTELTDLIEEKRKNGAKNIIFCGMGGSVLCVDTVRGTFKEMEGFPVMQTLSDTDPDGVRAVIDFALENDSNLENTYVVVTTKSGTTAETLSHLEVWERVLAEAKVKLEDRVIILTDPGSPPYETSFWRKRAENLKEAYAGTGIMPYESSPKILTIQLDGETDIGGRFTAPATRLFLLAAGLRGRNLEDLVQRAAELSKISEPKDNPFIELGVIFYSLAQKGIDQITLILPDELKEIAPWAEQLFEESLGKDDKGLHIVYGEKPDLTAYKDVDVNDRIFLRFKIAGEKDRNETFIRQLKEKGYPLIEQEMKDDLDITKVMYGLGETVATIAYLWDINFVDQPAVVLYKSKTKEYAKKDRSEIVNNLKARKDKKVFQNTGITVYYGHLLEQGIVNQAALESELDKLGRNLENASAEEVTAAIMRIVMAEEDIKCIDTRYYGYDKKIRPILEDWRNIVKKIFRRATKVSKGPDINHSGEQNAVAGLKGLRLINVAVPERPRKLSFGKFNYDDKLLIASALGTVDSQAEAGRPALLVTLPDTGKTEIANLDKFYKEVEKKIALARLAKIFPKANVKYDKEKMDKKEPIVSIMVKALNGTEITGAENGKKYYLNASLPYSVLPDCLVVKIYYPVPGNGEKVGIKIGKIVGIATDKPEAGIGILISNMAIDKEHRQQGLSEGIIGRMANIVSQGSILEGKIREIETLKDLYSHITHEKGFSLPEMFKQAPEKINELIGQIEELNNKIEPSRALGSKEPAEELIKEREEVEESLKNWLVSIIGYYLIDNQVEFDTLKKTILGKIWVNAGFRQGLHIYSVMGDSPAVFIKGGKVGISDFKSFWAEVFPDINVQLNKDKLTEPIAFVIDPALVGDNPSVLLAVLNLKEQLGDKIKIVFQHSQKSEELGRDALYETIKEATEGAVDLEGKVDLDVPAKAGAEEVIERIQKKFEDVKSVRVIGHQEWAKGFEGIERPGLEKITLVVCEIGEGNEVAQGDLAVLLGLKDTGLLPAKEMAELNRRWGKGGIFFIVKSKKVGEAAEIEKYREELKKFE